MWITNSYEAEVFLIFANVDPSKGYKGITCFIATKDMGIQIAKKEQKLGIRASSTCTLNFDDMKIPAENVIGEVGKGYKVRCWPSQRLIQAELTSARLQIAIEILNEGVYGPVPFISAVTHDLVRTYRHCRPDAGTCPRCFQQGRSLYV